MTQPRVGIWFIGARGGVAVTAIVGLGALKRGLTAATGLVSQLPEFAGLGLAGWDDFVIAGHEIRNVRSEDEAMRLVTESRVLSPALVEACREELEQIDGRVRPGTVHRVGPTIERLAGPEVPREESPRRIICPVAGRPARLCRFPGTGARGGGERGLDGAAGRPGVRAGHLGGAGAPAFRPGRNAACRPARSMRSPPGPGLFVRQFHPLAGLALRRRSTSWPGSAARVTWAATARRARRC